MLNEPILKQSLCPEVLRISYSGSKPKSSAQALLGDPTLLASGWIERNIRLGGLLSDYRRMQVDVLFEPQTSHPIAEQMPKRRDVIGLGDGQAYAGFWIRLVARLIDFLILGVPIGIILGIQIWVLAGVESMNDDVATALIFFTDLPVIVGPAFYLTLLWSKRGATVGQGLLGLRVVDATTGSPITLYQAWIRLFGQIVDVMLLGLPIGYALAAFDGHKQAWHDKIAGTVVLRPGHRGPYLPVASMTGQPSEPIPEGADVDWQAPPGGSLREKLMSPLPTGVVLVVTAGVMLLFLFMCWPAGAIIVWLQPWLSRRTKLIVILIGLAFDVAVLGPQMIRDCHLEGHNIWCQSPQ